MSELTVLGEFVTKNWVVVVRGRGTSRTVGRMLFCGAGLLALVVMRFVFPGYGDHPLRELLDYLPYLAFVALVFWGYLRQRVCFGKHRVARGWLMPRGVFMGCRSWSYSEIARVDLDAGFWNCSLTFYPEKISDAVLTVSVPKKSEQLKSIVALLSQGIDHERLGESVQEVVKNIEAGGPAFD
jgi:hypothetical protein